MNATTIAFKSGELVMTRGVAALLTDQAAALIVRRCLDRHLAGDCGEMSEDDVLANLRAVTHGGERVFSAYDTTLGRLWVITEADRSATTVLLPEEY